MIRNLVFPSPLRTLSISSSRWFSVASAYSQSLINAKSPPLLDKNGIVSCESNSESYTLPAEAYTCDQIFQEEQNLIFSKSWNYVDHISNLPKSGNYSTANIAGEEILLVRDNHNNIRAFYNVCSHRAHYMVEPGTSGRKPVLFCPNHAWSYKLDGTLHKARHTTNQPIFDPIEYGLKEIKLENYNGLLFVNLDNNAKSLFDYFDSKQLSNEMNLNILYMKKMKCETKIEKIVNANWKCLVDNFLECYHCDTAHKDFINMVDMDKYKTNIYSKYVYNYSPCKPENTAYQFDPNAPCQSIHYYWLWPNTVIYSSPGPPNMSILQFIPITPTKSIRRAYRFFAFDDNDNTEKSDEIIKQKEAAVRYLNEVLLEEDTKLCESIQVGISSMGYKQGRFVIPPDGGWTTEKAVAQFHGLCHNSLLNSSKK